MFDIDLSCQFEIIIGAMRGLNDALSPSEAGDVDHAQTVHVAVAPTTAFVKNLRSWNIKYKLLLEVI